MSVVSTTRSTGGRRAARFVAQGVILATVVAGTTAFATMHKTVSLEVDGETQQISGFVKDVDDVLASGHVVLGPDDQVFPSAVSSVGDGDLVVVRTVKSVEVVIDGQPQTIRSTALTVGEVLDEMGLRAEDAWVSASRSDSVGREPLTISTLKSVTLMIDGQQIPITTTALTVRDVLEAAGVSLEPDDTLSVPLDAATEAGQAITVSRGGSDSSTVTEVLPFSVEEVEDPKILEGQRVVKQVGVVGEVITSYDIVLADGVEVSRSVVAQQVVSEAKNEIVHIGTLKLPDPSTTPVDPGSARAIAQSMALERGWGESEFACLDSLWTKESGWRTTAGNQSSGAYGIPQALPGSKMASAGADWQTNAATQITWGLGYIAGRYGTPCSAWSHSVAKNWY